MTDDNNRDATTDGSRENTTDTRGTLYRHSHRAEHRQADDGGLSDINVRFGDAVNYEVGHDFVPSRLRCRDFGDFAVEETVDEAGHRITAELLGDGISLTLDLSIEEARGLAWSLLMEADRAEEGDRSLNDED